MERAKTYMVLLLALAFMLAGYNTAFATVIFSWSGAPIAGEDPSFLPSGTAAFSISGGVLSLTLTNTSSQQMTAIGQVLTGLLWDITDPGVTLGKVSAVIPSGSRLVGVGAIPNTNMSSEWAYRGSISAGSGLGSKGIGAMGDINLGVDTFGRWDRFDTTSNLFAPPSGSLNGIEPGLVGPNVNLSLDGFTSQGPVVQGWDGTNTGPGQTVFTFNISGSLTEGEITNVQPLFGTDGAPVAVPETGTLILLGSGLIGLAGYSKLRLRLKKRQ